jgi:hypothetical protein
LLLISCKGLYDERESWICNRDAAAGRDAGKGVAVARIEKDDIPDAQLEAAMRDVPKGAFALAGLAVALMLAGWFYVYFFIFVPRGAVG